MRTVQDIIKDKYRLTESGCWQWTAATGGSRSKRPQIRVNYKLHYAHRFIWESLYGPIKSGLLLCHKCDNPLCINPSHMFLGTQQDNMRDASRKGRFSGKKALDETIVKQILQLRAEGKTAKEISELTNIPPGTVGHIMAGTRWGECV